MKAFRKLLLEAGESREVRFSVSARQLSFVGRQLRHTLEPGMFKVTMGPSSAEGLEAMFELVED